MAKRGNHHTDQPKESPETNSPAAKKAFAKKPGPNTRVPKNQTAVIAKTGNSAPNKPKQPLTEDKMEVHHHPDLKHKHKPWKEYLLEGLMIFIAVMMGFIAENVREDITNHEHVTQLTTRLVHDLRADTAQLNFHINFETGVSKTNDTLISLLQEPLAKADLKHIQLLIYRSHSLWLFYPSNGAINAIKNELHLKQFSNSEIITYISQYEGTFNLLHTVQDITLQYQRTYLDPFMFDHFTPANLNAVFTKHPPHDGLMRNLTQDDLTHLAACMVLIKTNTDELVRDNTWLKEQATELLKYVNKTYHPQN